MTATPDNAEPGRAGAAAHEVPRLGFIQVAREVHVCAMTVDGGTLLYSVDEDENKRLTIRMPLPLAGVRERVDRRGSESGGVEAQPSPGTRSEER